MENTTYEPAHTFGSWEFSSEELDYIDEKLKKDVPAVLLKERPGAGGKKFKYLPSNRSLDIANDIFKFNGWSSQINDMKVDFVDETSNRKWIVGCSAIVRVTLKDGCFREDIGYGKASNMSDKYRALELAKKEAVTDGRKRALRQFGNGLGNSLYEFHSQSVSQARFNTQSGWKNNNSEKKTNGYKSNKSSPQKSFKNQQQKQQPQKMNIVPKKMNIIPQKNVQQQQVDDDDDEFDD